jgi:DNA-directed RNA polymerase
LFALIDGRGQARTREIASVCWDAPPTPRQIYSQARACKAIGAVRVRREGREWVWSLQNFIPHRRWLVEKHREAIAKAFPGFEPVRDFFRKCAAILAVHGEVLRWTSPSGVPVCNRYNEPDPYRKNYYLGAKLVQHKYAYGFRPELDKAACARGAAPNLVHSQDAAHLAFVALGCQADSIPLLTVHDCFAALGCHVDTMRKIWLHELVLMYENAEMLKQVYDYTSRYGTPPPIPPPLGLNLEDVNGLYALA